MLASLMINNVVLIDRLSIHFEPGLCALTGETGAGKSILLDSLGLALGARSESGLVRKEADQAVVAAEFDIPDNHRVFMLLTEQGIEIENPVILRRSVNADGKSRAFINDHPISVSLLKQIGEMLVEIHGQFDTQTLLNPRVHRGILDEYANVDTQTLRQVWDDWKNAQDILIQRKADMERARAEEDYLRSALEQLDELSPKDGEEEKLTVLRARLMKREQILENLSNADTGVEEAQNVLNTVWRALEKTGQGSEELLAGLERVASELQEVSAGVQTMSAELSESEYSLTEIDDRLFSLKAQARKHACSVDELPLKHEEIANLLKSIGHQEDTLSALEKDVAAKRAHYISHADKISTKRKDSAQKLDKLVAKELIPLKLEKARFETQVTALSEAEWGPLGKDGIQFMVATNPGSQAGALNKIASGGELARFMLALKVVLAEVGVANTLVFDEVDSGIGGATADAVGERLARLSDGRQILVVTHSPQVAARAAHHWIVAKTGKTNPTTKVIALQDDAARREEIARMLAGAEITQEARAAASKLLEKSAA
jgi:DNA repair protein RecN (Recombination protein N)